MSIKTEKRVFPAVNGVEVAIDYINKYGNKVAVNIGEKGYPIENNPDMTNDLKVKIMRNIHLGHLVVREVEVKTKQVDSNKIFLDEFEQLVGAKKVEDKKEPQVKTTPKTTQTTKQQTQQNKKEATKTTILKKKDS